MTKLPSQRLRHVHVIGASGSGKSTLLLSMAIQDIEAGNGFAVLDPHGDLIEDIMARIPEHRAKDVILFDPSDEAFPVGFNVLSARTETEKTLLSSDFVAVFRRLSSTTFGDQMVSVLGNAVLAILESKEGGTLLDLRRFLIDKAFRASFLETVGDEEVRRYWHEEFPLLKGLPHASILTRLNTFLRPKLIRYMVSQKGERFDLREIMDGKKILLAKLSHGAIGEENAHLLGSLLVAKIAQAAMCRQDEQEKSRIPFILYVDEFHNFATPSVATILTSVRKYGLGLCLAHHEMRQLKSRSEDVASAVLSNAYTRLVFRVGEQDAKALAEGFNYFEAKDLQSLGIGQAIARVERADFDFNLRTIQPNPVPADVRAERLAAVRDASRSAYGTPRSEIEAALRAEAGTAELAEGTEARPKPGRAKPKVATDAVAEAEPLPGRGGRQHKYLQKLLKRAGRERGFKVSSEEPVLDGHGHVDVVLERFGVRVACEISITTSISHELDNLSKCLAAGFDHVVLVSSEERVLELAEERFEAELAEEQRGKVEYLTPDAALSFLDRVRAEAHTKGRRSAAEKKIREKEPAPAPRSDEDGETLYNAEQAGLYVRRAPQTLAKLRTIGGGPHFHKIGRSVFYKKKDLDEWVDARRRRTTSDRTD